MNVQIPFEILGTDLVADVEFRITAKSYKGSSPSLNDPGSPSEGCEYDIESLTVEGETAPKWLYRAICASDEMIDAVAEAEDDFCTGDPDAEYDRRMSGD